MAKSSYEKALDKQIKEAKKQANEAVLRDHASARINGQQVVNGFRLLESSTEETLQGILQCYDGNENLRVSGNYEIFPEYVQRSIKLEFEILRMCGMIASHNYFLMAFGRHILRHKERVTFPQKRQFSLKKVENLFPLQLREKNMMYLSLMPIRTSLTMLMNFT